MQATDATLIIGSIVAGVGAIIALFFKQMNHSDSVHARELSLLSKALTLNTASNKEVARATTRSADEARDRNGHLAELTLGNRTSYVELLTDLSHKVDCIDREKNVKEVQS